MLVYETKKTDPNAHKKRAPRASAEAERVLTDKTKTESKSAEDSKLQGIGINTSVFSFAVGMAKTSCLGLAAHPILAGCLAIAGAAGFIYFMYFY